MSTNELKYEKWIEHINRANTDYFVACKRIQDLKSPWGLDVIMSQATLENVTHCMTLPRIEKICRNARWAYVKALNLKKKADDIEKVQQIFNTSNVYFQALNKRKELLAELTEARKKRDSAKQRYNDLCKIKVTND